MLLHNNGGFSHHLSPIALAVQPSPRTPAPYPQNPQGQRGGMLGGLLRSLPVSPIARKSRRTQARPGTRKRPVRCEEAPRPAVDKKREPCLTRGFLVQITKEGGVLSRDERPLQEKQYEPCEFKANTAVDSPRVRNGSQGRSAGVWARPLAGWGTLRYCTKFKLIAERIVYPQLKMHVS